MSLKLVSKCVSTLWSISKSDLANGLRIAVLGAVSETILKWCWNQHFPTIYESLHTLKAAGFAATLYLINKFISGPKNTPPTL